ncbi:M15 family metallopeptidase [Tropicimonas sp. IMCC6043]|uniref:M15 family metallopeptidase n=1 Tax=Tropicimonas sp. IMCC6043 TaxID=2510645 RepID=UPI00101CAD74|nr:M15 family metallopeptidase [Tropicimonas sp. IMCC6043]RYH11815.1 M15 family peptidase [Tropicimonas sp. IMCC6043]
MRLVPAIIIAVALLIAPVLWIVLPKMLSPSRTSTLGPDATVDDLVFEFLNQENVIFQLQERVDELSAAVRELNSQLQRVERDLASARTLGGGGGTGGSQAPIGEIEDNEYTEVVLIQNRTGFNNPLSVASSSFIVDLLGRPRDVLSDNCEPMTNEGLKAMLRTEQVGPVTVTMLEPAIESLKRVFESIRRTDPKLHDLINTAGALCVRQIRGTTGRYSNHSFGLAVDLNINGRLDNFTDGKTQLGLIIIADFFHEEGWIWGAGFNREDSMHFEVSKEKLLEWRSEGLI